MYRFFALIVSLSCAQIHAAIVTGTVEDASGMPIAGAHLCWEAGPRKVECATPSDASGRFSIEVPLCTGRMWAQAAGRAPGFAAVAAGKLAIRLEAERIVQGVVRRANTGEAVVGGSVEARLACDAPLTHRAEIAACPFAATVCTDERGRFRVGGLYRVEEYRLVVSAPECAAVCVPAPRNESDTVRVSLHREGTLTGIVLEKGTERPVAGATVAAERELFGPVRTTADASGTFVLRQLGNERVLLSATGEGALLFARDPMAVRAVAGKDVRAPTLYVEAGYVPVLRVLDRDTRQPIPGAQAWFMRENGRGYPKPITLATGEWTFAPQPRFLGHRMVVWAKGYQVGWGAAEAPAAGRARVETKILLSRALRVHVNVKNSANAPVEGASVVLRLPEDVPGLLVERATTSATGYAQLSAELEYFALSVDKQGYARFETQPMNLAGESAVDVILKRPGTLIGAVRVESGTPPAATVVLAVEKRERYIGKPQTFRAQPEPDGSWRIEGVPPNVSLTIRAEAPGLFADAVENVIVPEGGETRVPDIVLHTGYTLHGRVIDDASVTPVPGIRLTLREGEKVSVESDAEGRFACPGLAPHSYYFQLRYPDGSSVGEYLLPDYAYSPDADKTDEKEWLIRLRRAIGVEGVVTDAATRRPLVGAQLFLLEPGDTSGYQYGEWEGKRPTTDARGRFRAIGPAGWDKARLFASAEGYVDRSVELPTFSPDRPIDDLRIELTQGGTVSGQVVDGSGAPVSGIYVHFRPLKVEALLQEDRHGGRETAKSDGTFRSSAMAPGRWEVFVDPAGTDRYGSSSLPPTPEGRTEVEVVAGQEVTDVTLTQVASNVMDGVLTGWLLDHFGKPVAGANLYLQCVDSPAMIDPRLHRDELTESAQTDDAGRFRVEHLPCGLYRVNVDAPVGSIGPDGSRPNLRKQFDGIRVPSASVELRLEAPAILRGRVVDSAGGSLLGVKVSATRGLSTGIVTVGNAPGAEGAFELVLASTGTGSVIALAPDNRIGESEEFTALAGQVIDNVVVDLEAPGVVLVRLRDSRGRPVPGEMVELMSRESRQYQFGMEHRNNRETDAAGEARFTSVRVGKYELWIWSAWEYKPPVVVTASSEQVVEAVVPTRGAVAGKATDRNGRGVTGAKVGIGSNKEVRTDAKGEYLLEKLQEGPRELWVQWPESAGRPGTIEHATVEVLAGKTVRLDWKQTGGRLYGRVSKGSRPIPGLGVRLQCGSGLTMRRAEGETDEKGRYDFTGLPEGPLQLTLLVTDTRSWITEKSILLEKEVELRENEEKELDIALPLGRIRGVVVLEGHPEFNGTDVVLEDSSGNKRRTESKGLGVTAFEFDWLPAGRYRLSANEWGAAPAEPVDVELQEGQEREGIRLVQTEGATLTGVIRAPAGAGVAPVGARCGEYGRGDVVGIVPGRYVIRGLPAGSYAVHARASKCGLQIKRVEVKEDQVAELDFDLDPAVELELTLNAPDSATAEQALRYGCRMKALVEDVEVDVAFNPGPRKGLFIGELGCLPYRFELKLPGCQPAHFELDLTRQRPGSKVTHTLQVQDEH